MDVEGSAFYLAQQPGRRRASSTNCSFLVFIHLTRTEVSTMIFAAIAGVSVIANDVGRIPLANPLLFELSQWGKGSFPPWSLSAFVCQVRTQGFTNDLTAGAALSFSRSVHLFKQSIRYGDHHLGHGAPLNQNIPVHRKRSNPGSRGDIEMLANFYRREA